MPLRSSLNQWWTGRWYINTSVPTWCYSVPSGTQFDLSKVVAGLIMYPLLTAFASLSYPHTNDFFTFLRNCLLIFPHILVLSNSGGTQSSKGPLCGYRAGLSRTIIGRYYSSVSICKTLKGVLVCGNQMSFIH